MRRVPWSRTRLIGVVAVVTGALLTAGTGTGWWYTDLQARRTAHRLADRAMDGWAETRPPEGVVPVPAVGEQPGAGVGGRVIAVLRIPRFGPDWRMPVQRGTSTRELREGLGLYRGSPLPGRRGNVAIAGHRTTWGAPLRHLDRLREGDDIMVWTAQRRLDYRVLSEGVTVPADTSVINARVAGSRSMLTLTTCHPEFSARQRLYVHAVLVEP